MKKLMMVLALVAFFGLFGCQEESFEPIQEVPTETTDPGDGDDDDLPCGQQGGCEGG